MKPSAATLAAQDDFICAAEAHDRAKRAGIHSPPELAVLLAVSRMAAARLDMCNAADALAKASQDHAEALAQLANK